MRKVPNVCTALMFGNRLFVYWLELLPLLSFLTSTSACLALLDYILNLNLWEEVWSWCQDHQVSYHMHQLLSFTEKKMNECHIAFRNNLHETSSLWGLNWNPARFLQLHPLRHVIVLCGLNQMNDPLNIFQYAFTAKFNVESLTFNRNLKTTKHHSY